MTESADRKGQWGRWRRPSAKTPPKNHFKPLWLLTTIMVVLLIGGGTFVAVQRLTGVEKNRKSIIAACEQRNKQLTAVNEKFEELNILIEAVFQSRSESNPEVLAAFETLRQPIPTVTCK